MSHTEVRSHNLAIAARFVVKISSQVPIHTSLMSLRLNSQQPLIQSRSGPASVFKQPLTEAPPVTPPEALTPAETPCQRNKVVCGVLYVAGSVWDGVSWTKRTVVTVASRIYQGVGATIGCLHAGLVVAATGVSPRTSAT